MPKRSREPDTQGDVTLGSQPLALTIETGPIGYGEFTEQQLGNRLALAEARASTITNLYNQLKKIFKKTNPLSEEDMLRVKNLFAEKWLMGLSEGGFNVFKQAITDVVTDQLRAQWDLDKFTHQWYLNASYAWIRDDTYCLIDGDELSDFNSKTMAALKEDNSSLRKAVTAAAIQQQASELTSPACIAGPGFHPSPVDSRNQQQRRTSPRLKERVSLKQMADANADVTVTPISKSPITK